MMLSKRIRCILLLAAVNAVVKVSLATASCPPNCEHHCDTKTAQCACTEGYKLAQDHIHCIDINECDEDNGGCEQTCTNLFGSHKCTCEVTCRAGYALQDDKCVDACLVRNCSHFCTKDSYGTAQCSCPSNSTLGANQKDCVDPCVFSNGGCSHICSSDPDTYKVTCSCPEDYELDDTGRRCQLNRVECQDPLRQVYDIITQKCVDKCQQVKCEHNCIVNTVTGLAECQCNDGYELASDKLQCTDTDECAVNNGNCAENCTNSIGSYECSCIRGELDTDRHTCTVMNPCASENNGGCNHICRHLAHKSSMCLCYDGYVLAEDKQTCISKCMEDNGGCGEALCNLTSTGVVTCSCPSDSIMLNNGTACAQPCLYPGYELDMDAGVCRSLCSTPSNGGCSDGCEITPSGVLCSCPAELELMTTGQCIDCPEGHRLKDDVCKDIDECMEGTDGCEQNCTNTDGGFSCSCYIGELDTNKKDCTIVNVCENGSNGNCSQLCVHDAHKEYHCDCEDGYQLDTDYRSCVSLCSINNGGCEGTCTLKQGQVTCGCASGYVLVNSTHCRDICDNDVCDQVCNHTAPLSSNYDPYKPYECSCLPGFVMSNNTCKERCSVDNYGCINGTCVNHQNGSYACQCDVYKVLDADGYTCKDKNECLESNGQCSDICYNTDPGHRCECDKGELSLDGKTCVEINVCEDPNLEHRCSHKCVHVAHRKYKCECYPGYVLAEDGLTCINRCYIQNGGCNDYCQLVNNTGVVCSCKTGYALQDDGLTCTDVDECYEGTSGCDKICKNTDGSYTCSCPSGWQLNTDGHSCTDVDVCHLDNGGCSHTCEDLIGLAYVCKCPVTMTLMNDTRTCIDKCQLYNGGCSHKCNVNEITGAVSCSCNSGYVLQADYSSCQDIDECAAGTASCDQICINQDGGYTCKCHYGYYGYYDFGYCSDINECDNKDNNCSQLCHNTDGGYYCACEDGYRLSTDNHTCTDIDECDTTDMSTRVCSQYCTNVPGSYNCSCRTGFSLVNGNNCTDILECSEKNGGCAHLCHEMVGAYRCSCRNGYQLDSDSHGCSDINECYNENGGCSQICTNSDGSYSCSCTHGGYKLSADGKTCHDVNECENKNGGCSDKCANDLGSYHCECPPGYELDLNNRTCIDIDECLSHNGGCDSYCKNTLGSFNCSCPDGYSLTSDYLSCADINECTKGMDDCQQLCINKPGTFECSCNSGYELVEDGTTCTEIDRCKKNNGECQHVCTSTSAAAVCSCKSGYQLAADKQTCIDIDECAGPATGGCKEVCINLEGSYRCECDDSIDICLEGYKHMPITGQCLDINECEESNVDCTPDEECENLPGIDGKYRCILKYLAPIIG